MFIIKVTCQNPLDYILILICLFSEKEFYSEFLLLWVSNVCNPAGHIPVPSYAYIIYTACLGKGMASKHKMTIAFLTSNSFMCE